jgi:uncharacterized protein YbjT (DUF2867 family)
MLGAAAKTGSYAGVLYVGLGDQLDDDRRLVHEAISLSETSTRGEVMKIVVIGGTGLIGSKVVEKLKQKGHEAIAAAPNTGVNTITGEGLADALADAQVVVDVANSPSFEDQAAMDFFQTAGRNLTAAEVAADIKHHVALSVVGTDRLQNSGYFRAKLAQEKLTKSSPIPYTIVRATQFFEFLRSIAQSAAHGETVRLSHSLFQPMAAEDVATAVAEAALAEPANGTIEIAGPDALHIDEIRRRHSCRRQHPAGSNATSTPRTWNRVGTFWSSGSRGTPGPSRTISRSAYCGNSDRR